MDEDLLEALDEPEVTLRCDEVRPATVGTTWDLEPPVTTAVGEDPELCAVAAEADEPAAPPEPEEPPEAAELLEPTLLADDFDPGFELALCLEPLAG